MVEGPGCKINGEKLKKRAVGQTVAGVAGAVVKKSIQQSRDGASEYDSFYGQKITDVKTLGKELFVFLECELCLRVHFLMNGSLRFNDEPVWPNNKRDAAVLRLTLTTDTIYFFDTAIDTRSSSESQQKHRDLIDLDICSPTFDFQRAVRTIREHPSRVISDVILDQLVLPGVGNIIKNEALFNAGVNPNSKVEELSEELVSLLVKTNRDFTKIFYECRRGGGDLRKHMKVYKKSECQECGRKLMQCRIGENERLTFFCTSCQTNTLRLPSKNSLLGWVYNVKDGWTCAICTLENKGGVSRCSACLTPRPQTQGPNVSARVLAATASPVRGNKRKFEGGGGDAHSAKRSASVFGHGSHLAGTHASPASPAPKRASAPATPQGGSEMRWSPVVGSTTTRRYHLHHHHHHNYSNNNTTNPTTTHITINNNPTAVDPNRGDAARFLLSVVRIANAGCGGGDSSGTCYTALECRQRGGTSIGSCARGFGVCCYKEITCGGSTSTNCTHLVSPNYPMKYNEARTCTMTVTRTPDICQLRLDFKTFDTFPPDQFGVCNEDQFTVAGERKFTYLCGKAPTDWHFYLDVTGQANPTVFNFDTSDANYNRRFRIKVSMIECSKKVQGGCGQYLTGNSGVVQSFNYGGFYLAGLDYGICFRKEKGLCTTTLTRLGPSYTGCPDLYRLPVGQASGTSGIMGLDVGNMFCQLNIGNLPPFLSLATIPSPLSTVTNGPLTIWVQTLIDELLNFNSNRNCPACSGFYQEYTHNPC